MGNLLIEFLFPESFQIEKTGMKKNREIGNNAATMSDIPETLSASDHI